VLTIAFPVSTVYDVMDYVAARNNVPTEVPSVALPPDLPGSLRDLHLRFGPFGTRARTGTKTMKAVRVVSRIVTGLYILSFVCLVLIAGALRVAAADKPPRAQMFDNITVIGSPLVLSTPAEVNAAEALLGIRFPTGYREYVTKFGEGVLVGRTFAFTHLTAFLVGPAIACSNGGSELVSTGIGIVGGMYSLRKRLFSPSSSVTPLMGTN